MKDKLKRLKLQMKGLKKIEEDIEQSPDKQKSLTDPDARIMKGSMNSRIPAYNVQTAVDPESHLIVAHEVTQETSDRRQLFNMATQTNEILQSKNLKVFADKGYYKSQEILLYHEAGITTYLPKTYTSDNAAKGLFTRSQFIYIEEDNEYQCPAGERLTWRSRINEDERDLDTYRSAACP